MSRSPERPGDSLPTPEDFAGWPPLGALTRRIAVGPFPVRLERVDARVAGALAPFEEAAGWADAGDSGEGFLLEWTRASRGAWLEIVAGERARSCAWLERGGLAWATHHAALLMDSRASRGIVVLTDQDAAETARSAQNVLRVATAWRLVTSGRGLLVHASAVLQGRDAIVLLGPSGAGKSTAVRLAAPRPVLADDACILVEQQGRAFVFPAPFWAEPDIEGRSDAREPLPVAGILRLRQAPEHRLLRVGRPRAMASLLAHAPFVGDLAPLEARAAIAERIASAAACGELAFARDATFWNLIETEWIVSASGARQGNTK